MEANTLIIAILSVVSQEANLPSGLLSALCFVESSHRPHVVNENDGNADSVGLCQVQLPTAQMLGYKGTKKGLKDPMTNAFYAAKYLRKQIDRYAGNIPFGVAAYNAGRLKMGRNNLPVNQEYVNKVFAAWSENR